MIASNENSIYLSKEAEEEIEKINSARRSLANISEEDRGSIKMIELKQLNYLEDTKAIDRTIATLSGSERYNKILLVQGMISMLACAYNMYSLGFLNSLPKFKCPVNGEMKYIPEAEACKIIDQCSVEYFYEGWVKRYDMLCENRSSRVFYVSLIFAINATVFLGLSTIADIFGRNMILKMSTVIASLGTFLIYYVESYPAKIIIFGIVTGTNSIFQMMFTLGLKEAIKAGSEYNVYMNAILNCSYNSGPIFVAFMAYSITEYSTLSVIGAIIVTLGTVGNFFIFNETPLFLYKKKKGKELINKLFHLSKINSVTTSKKSILRRLIQDEIEFRKNQKLIIPEEGVKKTVVEGESKTEVAQATEVKDVVMAPVEEKEVNLVWITIVLCYWCASLYLVNYGTVISIDKSGMDNLYINSVLLGISSVIGYGVCLKFPKDVKRIKTISLIVICLLSLAAFILFLDFFSGNSGFIRFLKSLCTVFLMPIFVSMGFSVMYLYLPDVYPVTLRGLGIGCVICMGKIFGGSCSAYIANIMNQLGLNPIAGCAVPAAFLLILLRTVPDG